MFSLQCFSYLLFVIQLIFLNIGYITLYPNSTHSLCLFLDNNTCTIDTKQELPENTFENLHTIPYLNVQNNIIKKITKNTLKSLNKTRGINLNANGIEEIESGAFKELSKLGYLILSKNKIAVIQSDMFKELLNLRHLDLSENKNFIYRIIK